MYWIEVSVPILSSKRNLLMGLETVIALGTGAMEQNMETESGV